MSDCPKKKKEVKNETWNVDILIQKVRNNIIVKETWQRKKKWSVQENKKKLNNPSMRKYVEFLMMTENAIEPITFGLTNNSCKYVNIDGNNRINTLIVLMERPFEIFPEYKDELINNLYFHLDNYNSENNQIIEMRDDDISIIINIIEKMTYDDIYKFKYNFFFNVKGIEKLYKKYLKPIRDEYEQNFDDIRNRLLCSNDSRIDNKISIPVNIFINYSLGKEFPEVFILINRYRNNITVKEILAAKLDNNQFDIIDANIKNNIISEVKKYYSIKNEGELIKCVEWNEELNVFEFLTGFISCLKNECVMFNKIDVNFFNDVFNIINDDNDYSTPTVNNFIDIMNKVKNIFNRIIEDYTKYINQLYNNNRSKVLKKFNNKFKFNKQTISILIKSIIGYILQRESEFPIYKKVKKCIYFHMFCDEIKCDIIENNELKAFACLMKKEEDNLSLGSGRKLKNDDPIIKPQLYLKDISKTKMEKVMSIYIKYNINEKHNLVNDKRTNGKRRNLNILERILLIYYYKDKVPNEFINKYKYDIEHICPYSSSWEGNLDIDRLGNLVPLIEKLNRGRGNKHIKIYSKIEQKIGIEYVKFLADIIPANNKYDEIVEYRTRNKAVIKSNEEFNKLCVDNEKKYIKYFLNYLY